MQFRLMLSKAPKTLMVIKLIREMGGQSLFEAQTLARTAVDFRARVMAIDVEHREDAFNCFAEAQRRFERMSAVHPGYYGVWTLIDEDDVVLVSKCFETGPAVPVEAQTPSFAHEESIARWVCSGCGADVSALVWRAHICRAKVNPDDVTSRLRELVTARAKHSILAKVQPGRVDAGQILVVLHAIATKVTVEHIDGQVWVRADFGSNGIRMGFGPNLYTAAAEALCATLDAGL